MILKKLDIYVSRGTRHIYGSLSQLLLPSLQELYYLKLKTIMFLDVIMQTLSVLIDSNPAIETLIGPFEQYPSMVPQSDIR